MTKGRVYRQCVVMYTNVTLSVLEYFIDFQRYLWASYSLGLPKTVGQVLLSTNCPQSLGNSLPLAVFSMCPGN